VEMSVGRHGKGDRRAAETTSGCETALSSINGIRLHHKFG
jgi:hypothetical protein